MEERKVVEWVMYSRDKRKIYKVIVSVEEGNERIIIESDGGYIDIEYGHPYGKNIAEVKIGPISTVVRCYEEWLNFLLNDLSKVLERDICLGEVDLTNEEW